jgi:hypothetical protein
MNTIEMIKKYGIPNQAFPHCTRETKQVPINKFAKDYFNGEPYWTAQPITKQKINFWWKQQDFRLELKGYQGNCVTCWKK